MRSTATPTLEYLCLRDDAKLSLNSLGVAGTGMETRFKERAHIAYGAVVLRDRKSAGCQAEFSQEFRLSQPFSR